MHLCARRYALSVRRLALLVAGCFSLGSRAASGQTARGVTVAEGSVDVGGALLQQPGLSATNVLTAAGQFRLATPVSALFANGVGARTSDERYTGQGVLTGSIYAPPAQRFRWEVTATGSAFGLSNAAPAFAWQGLVREHLTGEAGGAFVGFGTGQLMRSGVWRSIQVAETGGYLRLDDLGRDELSAALAYTNSGATADTLGAIRYSDAVGYWTHRAGVLELSAGGGVRFNQQSYLVAHPWASANASLWISDRTALVFTGGRALADIARGIPSVRYLSLSIRIGTKPGMAGTPIRVRRGASQDDGGRLEVTDDDSLRIVTIHLPLAAGVELMGDFTDWTPTPMTKTPTGDWRVALAIPPGTHRLVIRVDDGAWTVPPNLTRVRDDFGGEVGILIVP